MKYLIFIPFFIFSCGKIQRVDTTKMKQLMKSHEIKKFTDAEINEKVNTLGSKLEVEVKNQDNDCESKLFKGIDLNQLQKLPNPKANEILEAYEYSFKNKEDLSKNVQKLNDTLYFYTFPIDKTSSYFTKCNYQLGYKYYSLKEILNAK